MRKILQFLCLLLLIPIVNNAQDLYNLDSVRTFYLDFYDADWDAILDTFQAHNSSERVLADLTVDGMLYDSVGVRFKGNSSYNPNKVKNPFNIDINYVKDQDLYGYTKLKLSNGFKDPVFLREVLSYEMLGNYMPCSRCNYVKVYVNDNIHGFYTSTESIDNDFLDKHFGSDDFSFFKCDPVTITGDPEPPPPGCEEVQGISSPLIFMGNDTACYKQSYEIKSDSDLAWVNLMELILRLNNEPAQVHELLDVDRSLWMLVFNNLFVNFDSYTGSGHNYYLYENEYGIFNTIIWDLNENFGVFKNGGQPGQLSLDQMQHLSTLWNINNPDRPLIRELMNIADYRKRYYAHYRTMVKEQLANNNMKNRAAELQSFIDPYVQSDPNYIFSYQDFLNGLEYNIGTGPGEIYGINVLMDERYNHLSVHQELIKEGPDITNIQCMPESPGIEDQVWITADITDVTNAWMHYKEDLYAPFQRVQMYDDGNHNDGAAGDNRFGAQIPAFIAGTTVYYYIYAENNDAGMFSPERAEYETLSYVITDIQGAGDLVINEFMASNSETVADQDGEYDDWIELYNNSSDPVNLNGIGLSDNFSSPFKWTFPDTVINGYSFIVVWADDDDEQAGLHTAYKLSKAGEEVMLTNVTGETLDSIEYSQQYSDTTFGRYPNGTGPWGFMPPTFHYYNSGFYSIGEIIIQDRVKIFPNPNNGCFTIYFDTKNGRNPEISISDIHGKALFCEIITDAYYTDIDISDIPGGIYIVCIKTGYNSIFRKIVIY